MDKFILKAEQKAFSGEDLHRLTAGTCVVRRYYELAEFTSLKPALGRHRCMILLYETSPRYGHWCAVFERDRGKTLEFFDPYGFAPDTHLSPGAPPYLTMLINATGYKKVVWNAQPLQKMSNLVSNCGRWCGLRAMMRGHTAQEFIALFLGQSHPPDWYATALTLWV